MIRVNSYLNPLLIKCWLIVLLPIGITACTTSSNTPSSSSTSTPAHGQILNSPALNSPTQNINNGAQGYRCQRPSRYQHKVIGSGYCVALVQQCSDTPLTRHWRPGIKVKGQTIPPGTIIATFKNNRYPNRTGYHSAVYIEQNERGIWVWDQWRGQPVHKRLIRFKNGQGVASNDGDAYSTVVR